MELQVLTVLNPALPCHYYAIVQSFLERDPPAETYASTRNKDRNAGFTRHDSVQFKPHNWNSCNTSINHNNHNMVDGYCLDGLLGWLTLFLKCVCLLSCNKSLVTSNLCTLNHS